MKKGKPYQRSRPGRKGHRNKVKKDTAREVHGNIPVNFLATSGHWQPAVEKGRPSVSAPQAMRRVLVLSTARPQSGSPLQSMVRKVMEALRQT